MHSFSRIDEEVTDLSDILYALSEFWILAFGFIVSYKELDPYLEHCGKNPDTQRTMDFVNKQILATIARVRRLSEKTKIYIKNKAFVRFLVQIHSWIYQKQYRERRRYFKSSR
jgi:hypothetical protein